MEKYYEEKEIREGKRRVCENAGCENILSRYNLTPSCLSCDRKKELRGRALLDRLVV